MFNHTDTVEKMQYSEQMEKEIEELRQTIKSKQEQLARMLRLWEEVRKKEITQEMDAKNYQIGGKV